ncbi:MAG: hypothetical protein EBU31_02150 [Proteobacteria bacterium]|nr:hypothetical protein [Pseudomonadota bacterium]
MNDQSVVVANAGSGKTYLLANRIIRWMLQERRRTGHATPERVLAVTFTRKAAAEIVARVLRHLAQGASDPQKLSEFSAAEQVGEFQAADYQAVLEEFVQALHRVSISTIDGFFSQLGRAFSPELGLPEHWEIGDEDELESQRIDAIGDVIAEDAARATELARRIGSGKPKVEIQAGIDQALKRALEVWHRCALSPDPRVAWDVLCSEGVELFPGARFASDDALQAAAVALRNATLPTTAQGKPRVHWEGARSRVLALMAERRWLDLLEDSFVQRIRAGEQFDRSDAQAVVRARLAATAEMVQLVDARIRESQRADGVLGFGDLAEMLARTNALGTAHQGDEALAAMRERLDRQIRDLAFDEFQDTAPAQWAVMSGLVEEITASRDRRLLVVGDPKQSIYAWRGGTPALLEAVRRREGLSSDVALDTSWRSSPVVLRFVDELFTGLPVAIETAPLDEAPAGAMDALAGAGLPVPDGVDRTPLQRTFDAWQYATHRAAPTKLRMPGRVLAYRALDRSVESMARETAAVVARRVADRPGAEIAVLVEKNTQVAACVAAIRDRGIEVSDEGRSPLSDSPAVAVALALLRLADHPGDRISHYVMTRDPACSILGLAPMELLADHAARETDARAISCRVRRELLEHGLGSWVDRLATLLRPACSRNDMERLRQLSALAHDAPADAAARPGDFVRSVMRRRSRTVERVRVRVMTVHASKGLEFEEVVLGSLGETMGEAAGGPGEWAVLAPDPVSPPVAVAPIPSKELVALSPLLAAFRAEAQCARLFDDVSALYVALTRAKEALHLVCPPPDAKEAGYLAGGADEGSPVWMYEPEDPALDLGPLPPRPLAVEESQPLPVAPELERIPRSTAVRAPSAHAAAEGRFFAREFAGADDGARGSLTHAWFERMAWCDGAIPANIDEADLVRAVSVEIGRPVEAELASEVRTLVRSTVAGPVAAVLRESRYGAWGCERVDVRSEMPFAVTVDSALVHGRMDRVVLGLRNGRVVRAEVVDWKTGATSVDGTAFEERIAGYRSQMAGYRRALCTMFGLEPEAVTAVLAFVDRGQLVEISGPLGE